MAYPFIPYQIVVFDNVTDECPVPALWVHKIRDILIQSLSLTPAYQNAGLLNAMINYRTHETIAKACSKKWIVALQTGEGELVGFAALHQQEHQAHYSWLQVCPTHQGRGLAKLLCQLREQKARAFGCIEAILESLVFPKTIAFHQKQGFVFDGDQRGLSCAIRMRKQLRPF